MNAEQNADSMRWSRRLLRGSRIVTMVILAAGPLATVAMVAVDQVFTAIVIVMTWMPALILAALFQASLVCHHCGKPFFRSDTRRRLTLDGTTNLFATHCPHCHHRLRS